MARKLNDTQLTILTNAAARDNRRVLPLPKLKAPAVAVTKTIKSMIADGFVEEIPATRDDDVWGHSETDGNTTLVITGAGLAAIGIEPEEATSLRAASKKSPTKAKKPATGAHKRPTSAKSGKAGVKAAGKSASPRAGLTKQMIVVGMLRRANGASIAELAKATDWQPHSVRGVLTATIKGRLNLPLVSEKGADGTRRYFIAPIRTGKE